MPNGAHTGGCQVSVLTLGLVLRGLAPFSGRDVVENQRPPPLTEQNFLDPALSSGPRHQAFPRRSHQTHPLRKPQSTCAAAPSHGMPVLLPPLLQANPLSLQASKIRTNATPSMSPPAPLCAPHGLWSRSLREPAVTCSDASELTFPRSLHRP